jgi:hypothetical protein
MQELEKVDAKTVLMGTRETGHSPFGFFSIDDVEEPDGLDGSIVSTRLTFDPTKYFLFLFICLFIYFFSLFLSFYFISY